MTDHAGPRRCECHPGTNFLHPPVEVTQFWPPVERFWRPFLLRPKRIYWSRGREKYETKAVGNGSSSSCFVSYEWIYLCLVFQKLKRASKTAPRVPRLGYFDERVPKLSSWGPAWSVIYNICISITLYLAADPNPISFSSINYDLTEDTLTVTLSILSCNIYCTFLIFIIFFYSFLFIINFIDAKPEIL